MLVRIEESDQQGAVSCSARNCPIAKALLRLTGKTWLVGPTWARLEGSERSIMLPASAQDYIADFDCKRSPKPISFEIEVG